MAVALIHDFPGGTQEKYEAVLERLDLGGRAAPGVLFHSAGPYGDGWRTVAVWEELDRFQRFREEKLVPAATEVGMPMPTARVIEVHERKPGSGARPELVQIVLLPGLDAESFAAADERVLRGDRNRPPAAVTFHVNGPYDGGWCVVDAWDSKAARDRFVEEQIKPALEGAPLTGPPTIEDLTVVGYLAARAAAPA